ncbi:hypothetical protein RO3G_02552 [Rhizopus delemar RA 99-880]|uniref:Uncharacterized protein n=1 Tax=Rhizopus delemar (strain RA 99-880 / ATCC MYA-4621 / FGSC 9543 / NRRL 43880) TaxID=246409 RepID=I1BNR8_RHIO9|nr:hypothetical protein RO3G_02552 [Rhizopus delemar RA 99-880]|eukprot:EIE77848.1 hypothetical protein RO3G_02552 [Rhizopus delemar RA 99-880]
MKDSQRKLFTEEQWTELNNLWSKRKEWIPIEKGIQKELKCIEQLAVDNVQAVYVKYLEYQMRYALNENETYFEVYGAMKVLREIAGTEGQISRVCLMDRGLYVANHIGSLRLPSSEVDLRKVRSLLERLFTIKQNISSQRGHFDAFEYE